MRTTSTHTFSSTPTVTSVHVQPRQISTFGSASRCPRARPRDQAGREAVRVGPSCLRRAVPVDGAEQFAVSAADLVSPTFALGGLEEPGVIRHHSGCLQDAQSLVVDGACARHRIPRRPALDDADPPSLLSPAGARSPCPQGWRPRPGNRPRLSRRVPQCWPSLSPRRCCLRTPQPRHRLPLALRVLGTVPARTHHRRQHARPTPAPLPHRRHRRRLLPLRKPDNEEESGSRPVIKRNQERGLSPGHQRGPRTGR